MEVERKIVNSNGIKSEKRLRNLIRLNLNKVIHPVQNQVVILCIRF